ncbi:hypothetical protein AB0H57_09440 [Micromonospora sp. NPDC050686]|uniref:hypothetical protein n=1 Tax=Micromonospora sp. NPDC050686 TaxID=3154631 RepID=UPI0033CEDC02
MTEEPKAAPAAGADPKAGAGQAGAGGPAADAKGGQPGQAGDGAVADGLATGVGDGPKNHRAAEGDARAGDEDRTREQEEFRRTRSRGLGAYDVRKGAIVVGGAENTFNGPVAGRDVIIGATAGDQAVSQQLPPRTVAEAGEVYVPPGGFDEIRHACDGRFLLLLRCCRRWGGSSTAVELLRGMAQVHELRFGGDLANLPVESLPEGYGYVFDRITARQVASLRAQDLAVLEERLAKRDSKLVVVVDAEWRFADHAVERAAQRITAPPAAAELVTRHLTLLLDSAPAAEQLLAEPGVGERLAVVGPDSFDASQLVELARDLAEVARHELGLEEALSRFEERSQRDVESWYDDTEALDQRALVLALAVLDGMPFDAVARASGLLVDAWRADEAGAGAPPPRDRRPRKVRLRAARARIDREVWSARYGSGELEVVSFLDDTYPRRILRHAWHEHDYDRELLLRWLRQLAADVEGRVGIRAAQAIGYLSWFAFDTIRRDIITPWAVSGDGGLRERGVAALEVAARGPEVAERAFRLVLDWYGRRDPALRRMAARALGDSVGMLLAGGPDERLAELAKDDDLMLHILIGDSIAELVTVTADAGRRVALLRLLDDWSAESASGRQSAGVLGFLEVAASLWLPRSSPDGEVHWPALLWLATVGATEDTELAPARPIIARLWGRALVAPRADDAVHRVLRGWAWSAQRWPELRPHLIQLLVEAATTKRQGQLLAAHARRWRDPEPLAPDLAARLLDVLDRRGRG